MQQMCVFCGTTQGPWSVKENAELTCKEVTHLTVGDRVCAACYADTWRIRHKQKQSQLHHPNSKKWGLYRSLPPSFAMKLPVGLTGSDLGFKTQHSLVMAINQSGR
jgi:hypothetical protein